MQMFVIATAKISACEAKGPNTTRAIVNGRDGTLIDCRITDGSLLVVGPNRR